MRLSADTCLPVGPTARYHYKKPTKHVSLVQSENHHHLIECNLTRQEITEKLLIWRYTTITHSLRQYH